MTNSKKTIYIVAGDGIGPEVMTQVERVLAWFDANTDLGLTTQHGLIGGAAIDAQGVPLSDETVADAAKADAILLGAVGGPKWDNVPYHLRPEAGLLKMRKDLDLFANLRPAIVFPALAEASSLKTELVSGLDIMIVRELTGGVYFGEPRGIETLPNGERRGVNTHVYTTSEIQRVTRVAFELARQRRNHVTSCEKANVMDAGKLWREEVTALHAAEYKDIELQHMYADNAAMQLLRYPKQFDVIVTDNLFGDILSDQAAMLTGSLGMLPSASLGATDAQTGKRLALYEPVHGSAPDIAGQNKANPCATLLSVAMMFRYSFNHAAAANALEQAIAATLNDGVRTADIAGGQFAPVSTVAITDAILQRLPHHYATQQAQAA